MSPAPATPSDPPRIALLQEDAPDALAGSLRDSLEPVLGRSSLQRHLIQVSRLGLSRCRIVAAAGPDAEALLERCRSEVGALSLGSLEVDFEVGGAPERRQEQGPGPRTLWIRPDAVFDPRLYAGLSAARDGTHLAEVRSGERDGDGPEPLGMAVGRGPGVPSWDPSGLHLLVDDLPHYLPSLRRVLRPFACPTDTPSRRAEAAHHLLDATQKGVLDFPARFLHPPLENLATRWLASTGVTPNQITAFTGIVGFLATWLFARAAWGPALAVAFAVNVLDGVDGKLARVKLLTSRFGDRLDHTLDVLFEFSWYLGIGWGLSTTPGGRPITLAAGLVLLMLGTRAMSGVYTVVTGRQIHDHRQVDRAFRLVAGRRNVFVLFLIAGAAVGRVGDAFRLCFAWAVFTLAFYAARTATEALRRGGSGPATAPEA